MVLVEALADETLALGEAVTAEDADGGAQEVEALAGLAAHAVTAGGGGLVDGLYDAGGSLVVVAVDLVVVGATVVETDVGEEGADGTAVAQRGVGPVVLGLGQLLDVTALEGAVVGHDVAAVDAARVAHGLRVVGTCIEPEVAGDGPVQRERGEEEQVGVSVLVLPDFIVEGLGVEFEGQAEGDVEVGRLVLVSLAEGEAVGVVPKVVAELVVSCRGREAVEVGLDAVEVGRGADAVVELEVVGNADAVASVETGGYVTGGEVLGVEVGGGGLQLGRCIGRQRVDANGEGVGALGIAERKVEVEDVFANVLGGVEGVGDGEGRTAEVLGNSFVAVVERHGSCLGRGEQPVHLVGVPASIQLQHIGKEACGRVVAVASLCREVVEGGLAGHGLLGEQSVVVRKETVALRIAFATDAVVVEASVEGQFLVVGEFFEVVHANHMGMVVEGAFLWQSRPRRHDSTHGTEGIERHGVDAIVGGQFFRHVVARVVALIQAHVLACLGKVHAD